MTYGPDLTFIYLADTSLKVMYPIFYLSIIGAGCRVVGGNPGHTVFEIGQMLSTCNVRLIVTEPQLLDKVQQAADRCGIEPLIFSYDPEVSSVGGCVRDWHELLQHGESEWKPLSADEAKTEVAAYFSTSGTTGSPKYAAVSHSYLVTGGSIIERDVSKKPYPVSRLVSLPLMHAFAAPLVIVAALRCGTPTYLMARFSGKTFLEALSAFKITEIPVVPSMLSALLACPEINATSFESIREIMSAGAPLSRSLAMRYGSLLPYRARLIQLYGLTEAAWIASVPYHEGEQLEAQSSYENTAFSQETVNSDSEDSLVSTNEAVTPDTPMTSASDFLNEPGPTIGRALPGYRLCLLDIETNQVISTPNILGEILVEAPHPFLYYLEAPEATAAAFIDIPAAALGEESRRLIRSGDIASFDINGDFFIVDRLKDLIKVRAWQVSPAELESVLLHHPGVADAAVVGLPDNNGVSGELPHAFVVRAENTDVGATVTEFELKRWVRSRLAAYKALASVRFVESVPRNPAGKILRRLLRDSC